MEVMDYEKKYKEALERAKQLSKELTVDDIIEQIFYELAENEDEKIRKALLEMVHDTTGDSLWVDYGIHKEEALSWLEKQDSKNHQKDIDDAYLKGICDAKRELEKQGEQNLANSAKTCKDEQKPTEWSEEDSKRLQRIIDFLWYNRKGDTDTIYQQEQDIEWLKSLRPQNHWKPTNEQLIELRRVISGCSYDIEPFLELEEQLKKLL